MAAAIGLDMQVGVIMGLSCTKRVVCTLARRKRSCPGAGIASRAERDFSALLGRDRECY